MPPTCSTATPATGLAHGPFADEDAYRRCLIATCLDADPRFHAVLDPSGRPVGVAAYLRIDPASGVIEVGHIHFSPALQRCLAGVMVSRIS